MSSLQTTGGFDNVEYEVFQHQGMHGEKPQLDGGGGCGGVNGGRGGDGMTRDFLGLRTFSHKDFLSMAGLNGHINSSDQQQQQQQQHHSQTPW